MPVQLGSDDLLPEPRQASSILPAFRVLSVPAQRFEQQLHLVRTNELRLGVWLHYGGLWLEASLTAVDASYISSIYSRRERALAPLQQPPISLCLISKHSPSRSQQPTIKG